MIFINQIETEEDRNQFSFFTIIYAVRNKEALLQPAPSGN
jgi:hypothetical protein